MSPLELISLQEVTDLVRYRRTTIYRLIRRGLFPRQVRLGDRKVAWVRSEVEAWLLSRLEARNVR
jgi:prophage regulatory protein